MGDLESSLADLQQACDIEEGNASAHNNLGLSNFEANRYMNAVDNFTRAIELDPYCAAFYNNRGLAQYHLNLFDDCLSDFEDAIKLNDHDPNYFFNRGNAMLAQGRCVLLNIYFWLHFDILFMMMLNIFYYII